MKLHCNNSKKGITLVEVVVSMGIITIVTVAAITLLASSLTNTKKMQFKNEARYFAADTVECFRAATDATDFGNLMEFRVGYSATEYTLTDSGYKATVTVDVGSDLATLVVRIKDPDENLIVEQTFVKAVTSWDSV